jgi:8-oxo-dGTP diphosphatase
LLNPVDMSRPLQADGRLHGVIAAIQDDRGRWLMIRRSALVIAPGKVCFPGGAVEVGEAQEAALVREMREELGLIVKPLRRVWRWESPDRPLTLWGWTAQVIGGQINPSAAEVAEVFWLTSAQAVEHADAIATNCDFVSALVSAAATAAVEGEEKEPDASPGASASGFI